MYKFLLSISLASMGSVVLAADPSSQLAQNLVRLRGEVEQLNSQLETMREEQRMSLAAMSAQKNEMDSALNRQSVVTRELQQKISNLQSQTVSQETQSVDIKPILLTAIDALEKHIEQGLPFKRDERLASLNQIAQQIETNALPLPRSANRVWAFFEDEFRIARETGMHRQTIELGNQKVLADVAKIGAVMLFFKTTDNRYGSAKRNGTRWDFVATEEPAEVEQIALLFDSLGKQIRQGYFELPNALAAGAAR